MLVAETLTISPGSTDMRGSRGATTPALLSQW